METSTYTVWIDHSYEGEKFRYASTIEEARKIRTEAAADPYVMRTQIWDADGEEIS